VGPEPRRVGRYELLTRLSAGGMAELFLARVTGPGRFSKFVAIKCILPTLKHEEEFVAMFLDEARISASLSHANIVQVYDLAEHGDELFIAMEFIAGVDLHRIARVAERLKLPLPVGLSGRWFVTRASRSTTRTTSSPPRVESCR
jgi:serine/threonine-protein kinase